MSNYSGSVEVRGKTARPNSQAISGALGAYRYGGSAARRMAAATASVADFIVSIGLRQGFGVAHTLALFGLPSNISVDCGGTIIYNIMCGGVHAGAAIFRARRCTTLFEERITPEGDYRSVRYGG